MGALRVGHRAGGRVPFRTGASIRIRENRSANPSFVKSGRYESSRLATIRSAPPSRIGVVARRIASRVHRRSSGRIENVPMKFPARRTVPMIRPPSLNAWYVRCSSTGSAGYRSMWTRGSGVGTSVRPARNTRQYASASGVSRGVSSTPGMAGRMRRWGMNASGQGTAFGHLPPPTPCSPAHQTCQRGIAMPGVPKKAGNARKVRDLRNRLLRRVRRTNVVVALLGKGGHGLSSRRRLAKTLRQLRIVALVPEDDFPRDIGPSLAEEAVLSDADTHLVFIHVESWG